MAFDLDEDELKATRKMNKADRNEIEVGEYVRTEKGLIAKYLGFEKDDSDMEYNKHLFDNKIYWYYEYYNEYVYEEDWERFKESIVKHSKYLVDLIEVGDIVNDYKVLAIKDSIYENSKRILIYKNEKERYERWIYIQEYNGRIQTQDDIVIILTKEQYKANCYKVGEEDDEV